MAFDKSILGTTIEGRNYHLVGALTTVDADVGEKFLHTIIGGNPLLPAGGRRFIIADDKLWIRSNTLTGDFFLTIIGTSLLNGDVIEREFVIKPEAVAGAVIIAIDNNTRDPSTSGPIGKLSAVLSDGSVPFGTFKLKEGHTVVISVESGVDTVLQTDLLEIRYVNNDPILWLKRSYGPLPEPAPGGIRANIVFVNRCCDEVEKPIIIVLNTGSSDYINNVPIKQIVFDSSGAVAVDAVAGTLRVINMNDIDITNDVSLTLVNGDGSQNNTNINAGSFLSVQLQGTAGGDTVRFRIKATYKVGRFEEKEANFEVKVLGTGTAPTVSHDVAGAEVASGFTIIGTAVGAGGVPPYTFRLIDTSQLTIDSLTGDIQVKPNVIGIVNTSVIARDSENVDSLPVVISTDIIAETAPSGTIVLTPSTGLSGSGSFLTLGDLTLTGFPGISFVLHNSPANEQLANINEFQTKDVADGFHIMQVNAFNDAGSTTIQGLIYEIGAVSFAICGTPNADPTIFVTLTWTDADVTKTYLGCSFTNGETKEVFADTFFVNGRWRKGTVNSRIQLGNYVDPTTAYGDYATVDAQGIGLFGGFWQQSYFNSTASPQYYDVTNTQNLATNNMVPANFGRGAGAVSDAQFGQWTDINGITLQWARGNGW